MRAFNPDRNSAHGPLIRAERFACLKANHPIMQGTRHRGAMHDPLAERAAFMRTMIFNGEELIFSRAEDRDSTPRRVHAAGAAPGNVVDSAYRNPIHCSLSGADPASPD